MIVLSVWEKWFKRIIFQYDGNITGHEKLRDGHHSILISPLGGRQGPGQLETYSAREYPSLNFTIEEDSVCDPRSPTAADFPPIVLSGGRLRHASCRT